MTQPSILFAIPCFGGQIQDSVTYAMYQVAKNFEKYGIRHNLMLVANESLIPFGRSNIANMFINDTDYDYLMCIDADMGFKWEDIIQLLEHHKEFVTGAYSMKIIPPRYNFTIHHTCETEGNLIRLEAIGTGFQLVHRSVFGDIAKKFPELKYIPNEKHRPVSDAMKSNSYHFYDTMIDTYLISEDISFCKRYNATGGKIWLDPTINLTHCGNHVFHGVPDLKDEIMKRIK